jgi:hypothetical protein
MLSTNLDTTRQSIYVDAMDAVDKARHELDARLREAVAADPLQALAAIGAVGRDLAVRQGEAVRAAAQEHTWSEIGTALGVTKQAAHQRFARVWTETLKDELRQASREYRAAATQGTPEGAAAAKARMNALIAELKGASRRRV